MAIAKKTLCRWTQDDLDRIARIGKKVGTVEMMSTIRQAIYHADLLFGAEPIPVRVRRKKKKISANGS
jgi:hypothetical protein